MYDANRATAWLQHLTVIIAEVPDASDQQHILMTGRRSAARACANEGRAVPQHNAETAPFSLASSRCFVFELAWR